ncbi:uncharacterized protein LOC116296853, partial [Actinia tenebrosa]|uniref:Uncharacterized protein LOC116296853 n=1 Tax=Actinia tenebrosa TaxID=6105 RepID=A0A6P8I7Z3_ACTTE
MAEEGSSSEVDVLESLKSELILDYCSYKLWNEFKRSSQMTKGLLKILKDVYICKENNIFDEELKNKLNCTRFICGLSEARVLTDDGNVKYKDLHPNCLSHAEDVLKMYPFSASEQSHFRNMMKLQLIVSSYRAGKLSRARKIFLQLYPETTEADEEYQDEIQELLDSENETLKQKILLRFSYEKFLRNVCDFLTPLWEKYDIPLLEKFKGELSKVDDGRIPGFFLKAYHDCSVFKNEDCEASWQSIINETHPDIKAFKKKLKNKKETTTDSASENRKSAMDHDRSLSSDVDEEIMKSRQIIIKLTKSSKQLNEFVKKRNQRSAANEGSDDEDDDDVTDDNENIRKQSPAKESTKNKSPMKRSPLKRRWNDHQKDAEVIEWSLSEDEEHQTICLPAPKRKLKIQLPSPSKRRKKNPWSKEEVTWLTKGVDSFGEGNWSTILRMFAFRCRTAV